MVVRIWRIDEWVEIDNDVSEMEGVEFALDTEIIFKSAARDENPEETEDHAQRGKPGMGTQNILRIKLKQEIQRWELRDENLKEAKNETQI